MKMDLRWGYKNVRIKKGDKQKAVLLTPESAFELTVMFFELTNSLVTFQAIMNDLLRNIIEAENVMVFINDVMVGIKIEEEHDDIMKEVLKNNRE